MTLAGEESSASSLFSLFFALTVFWVAVVGEGFFWSFLRRKEGGIGAFRFWLAACAPSRTAELDARLVELWGGQGGGYFG